MKFKITPGDWLLGEGPIPAIEDQTRKQLIALVCGFNADEIKANRLAMSRVPKMLTALGKLSEADGGLADLGELVDEARAILDGLVEDE